MAIFIAKNPQGSSILLTSEVPQRNFPRIAAFYSTNPLLIDIGPVIAKAGGTDAGMLSVYRSQQVLLNKLVPSKPGIILS